jgi:hypothetical protein
MEMKKDRIKHILEGNIVKMYLEDKEAMKKSLKWLDIEFEGMSAEEAIEKYEYILEDYEKETERYAIVRYGNTAYIKIYLYNEEGKLLDRRNKRVKNFHKDGFYWNYKSFEKTIVF